MALAVCVLTAARPVGQGAPSQQVSPTLVFDAVKFLSTYADVGLPREDVVTGDRTFDGTVLAADTLTLTPGSRLIFTGAGGDQVPRYVLVRTLRVPAGPQPAVITWDRSLRLKRIVGAVGKAPPGLLGGGEGYDGGQGPDGQMGNPGFPGRSAPTIYLVTNRIEGKVMVDLRGQDGGDGGPGQTGGDGGLGRSGASASAILGRCRAEATNGGNGGKGGSGGPGGEGGRGGNGGTLVLLGYEKALDYIAGSIIADVQGGKPGAGGVGGEPGKGGDGGIGGRADPPCPGGQPGRDGEVGKLGSKGSDGTPGQIGLFAKSGLTDQQVRSLQLRGEGKR